MSTHAGVFDPDSFDRTAAATVPGYQPLQELVALAAAAGASPASRVLDVGCGTGAGVLALARFLPAATLVACDTALPMITATRARCAAAGIAVRAVHGSIDALGDDEPAFDVVVCTLVYHFVPVEQRVSWLRVLKSLLRPGGKLVLTALARSDEPRANERWAMLRQHYAAHNGVSPEMLAHRQSQNAAHVAPVLESEFRAQLLEAGFGPATTLYQILAVKCWFIELDGGAGDGRP